MADRKISIVIITRNRSQELRRAIQSCMNDSPEINKEFIIIDNHSEDDTFEIVQDFIATGNRQFIYYRLMENLGVAGGRNFGFEKATNNIVFFLDDDAVLQTENTLAQMLEQFEKTERCGCVAPFIYQPLDNSNLNGEVFTNSVGEEEEFSYIGAAHAIDKRIWNGKQLYPEKLQFGSEELYASLFLRVKGYKLIFRSDIKVYHLPSKIERYAGRQRTYNIILNTFIIRFMYYPIVVLPGLLCCFLLRCILHKFSFRQIKQDLVLRYDKTMVHRMSIIQFFHIFNARIIGVF